MGQAAKGTSTAPAVAPSVQIAPPDSAQEREADRIADAVVRGTGFVAGSSPPGPPRIHRQCAACTAGGPPCADCAEDADALMLKPDAGGARPEGAGAAARAVSGSGQPLSPVTRAYFEPRLGADLSLVRLHTDAKAGAAARNIGARAYALGSHIAFAPGAFDPVSTDGRRLVAHELAHVVGQHSRGAIHRAPGSDGEEVPVAAGGAISLKLTAFTGDPADPAADSAKGVAKKRVEEGSVDAAFPISKLEDIPMTLDKAAFKLGLISRSRVDEFNNPDGSGGLHLLPAGHPGFVRHLDIIGHGKAGTKSSEPFYGFGSTALKTSELANLHANGLDLSRYMIDGGTLVLEGCNTAKGAAGKLYMLQVGRMFFGKKNGTIKANSAATFAFAGEMVGGDQQTFNWPGDFRKMMKTESFLLLSGTWKSESQTVRLEVDDNGVVTGSYGKTGKLSGSVDGDRIDYQWTESSGSGFGYWELNRVSGQLEGRWGRGTSTDDGGTWNMWKQ